MVISVAVIEDNRLVREGIAALLSQTVDFKVVAAVPSGDPALLKDLKPQLILLDVGLQDYDSLRVVEAVKLEFPDTKVITMDLLPVHEDIVEFVNAADCARCGHEGPGRGNGRRSHDRSRATGD